MGEKMTLRLIAIAIMAAFNLGGAVTAAEGPFSTFTIHAGAEAGSGYDMPARVLSRHIAKHLPGSPSVVVRNMPGANGIVLGNYMNARAARDGSEIAIVHNTVTIDAMMGNDAVRFKPQDFVWLGSTSPLTNTCVVWRSAQARTFADAREQDVRVGATSATDATALVPLFLNTFTGSRFKVTRGYQGTGMIYNAMEKGEIDGVCAAWDSIAKWRPEGIRSPDIRVLVQVGAAPDPTLGAAPFVMDLARNASDRETLRFLTARQAFARPFIAPPGIAPEKTVMLRKAFMDTMGDPAFLEDAKRSGMPVDPINGEAVQKLIAEIMTTPMEIVRRAEAATQ
jgi:tripartite-type tricarboxylate transporter receptor subunit TctC